MRRPNVGQNEPAMTEWPQERRRTPLVGEMDSEYLRETLHRFKLLLFQHRG
jgi:hypothetical protein